MLGLGVLFGISLWPLCYSAVHVVSPLGQFPMDPTTQTWHQSKDLAATLSAVKKDDIIYLCEGEEFVGPFLIAKPNTTITSYPCTQGNAGIKPLLTVSRLFQGSPTIDPVSKQWAYDLSGYKQYFDDSLTIAALWINGTRYYPARFPNLLDPANPVGRSTAEFIYPEPWNPSSSYKLVDSLKPSTTLKNLKSDDYWVGATLRIRETDWGYTSRTVAAVQGGKLIMSANFSNSNTISGGGFFIEHNRPTEMDAPGEFYFDNVAYKLYVIPMSGHQPSAEMRFLPQDATLIAAGGGKGAVFAITGNKCVVDGLAFRFGFVGIDAPYALQVVKIEVRDMVSLGVDGNMRIVSSTFSDIGAIGANLMPGEIDLLVQSSRFENVALWAGYYAQPTGIMCFAQCTVQGSTFDSMGYAAIYPNKPYSVITTNEIKNVMLGLSDGGAIYYGSVSGNIFIGNTVVNIVGNTISGSSAHRDIISTGFYLDTYAYNATIVGNTIVTNYCATPDLRQSCIKLDNGDTTITDNVCVGGKFDISLTDGAIVSALVIDRNVFTPTPGTPGQTVPLLIRFDASDLRAPYLPTRETFKSVAENTFCTTAPGTSTASWNPIFIGYTPVIPANDLGISNFVNVSSNRKDTSGHCPFTAASPQALRVIVRSLLKGLGRQAKPTKKPVLVPSPVRKVLRSLVRILAKHLVKAPTSSRLALPGH